MKAIGKISFCAALCLFSFMIFLSFGAIRANAYVTIGVEIPVTCLEVSDGNSHTYEIRIESENDESPAPRSDLLQITENGTGYFEIDITEPGTFRYRIYEKEGSDPEIKYDGNIYSVVIFAENGADGELLYSVSASIEGSDTKLRSVEFHDVIIREEGTITPELPPAETAVPTVTPPPGNGNSRSTEPVITAAPPAITTVPSQEPPAVTTTEDKNNDPVTDFIDNVLTGDSFSAHTFRLTFLVLILITISTFLFKRENREEEDEHENEK